MYMYVVLQLNMHVQATCTSVENQHILYRVLVYVKHSIKFSEASPTTHTYLWGFDLVEGGVPAPAVVGGWALRGRGVSCAWVEVGAVLHVCPS